ncbi:hypothetical protein BE844_09475 [Legionella pneumophila subsp. pneumophila]|nr:hypothetical protein BE844_09475 [Legionella pneumophila subsp. pneumophila]
MGSRLAGCSIILLIQQGKRQDTTSWGSYWKMKQNDACEAFSNNIFYFGSLKIELYFYLS